MQFWSIKDDVWWIVNPSPPPRPAATLAISDLVLRAFALKIYFQQSHWCVVFQLAHFIKWGQLMFCWKMLSRQTILRNMPLLPSKVWYCQGATLVYMTKKKAMHALWQFPSTKRCHSIASVSLNFQGYLGIILFFLYSRNCPYCMEV